MNILLVEDDQLLGMGLMNVLSKGGYSAKLATSGHMARGLLLAYDFDLVVLDLGLPDMDGISLLSTIRQNRVGIPVLVLTARDGVQEQVNALDAGADDYMEKPFDLRELQARIKALLRRSHAGHDQEITLGPLKMNPFSRSLELAGNPMDLPGREYEVLEALLLSTPSAVSKERLAQRLAMNRDDVGDNAVEVYIHRLRRRLENSDVTIRTIRSYGYSIETAS